MVEEDRMDVSESNDEEENAENDDTKDKELYLPGKPLEADEELICDKSAYVMLHQAQTGAPCLSFDIIHDNLGTNRDTFPLTAYIVAGTQAAQNHVNNLVVMKLHNLHKTNEESDSEESDDDDEAEEKYPKMSPALIKHAGGVNRIRSCIYNDHVLAASWSELGRVNIFDLSEQINCVNNPPLLSKYNAENKSQKIEPIFTFKGHQKEGFGIDWSSTMPGVLATGDCRRDIHIWKPNESGSWTVDQRPLVGHTDSVEDLQWSPNEQNVLASCSIDKSLRIWDIRASPSKACMLTLEDAHKSDVNVISWNKNEPFIVSGGDDGFVHVWDLRKFPEKSPIATFKHHTQPVTTVEWHPTDTSVFASGGSDDQIALWDLSIEKDNETTDVEVEGLPPQLLFIHQGQNNIKELHWHPQLTGVLISTAESGFNIFRTISV